MPRILRASALDTSPVEHELDERERRLRDAIFNKVRMARLDPAYFFPFVLREEMTQARLVIAPHQLLLFDFVMAHHRCVVRLPVGFSKTYCMAALTMWLLGTDPTQRGAFISATQGQAQKPLGMISDYIANKNGEHPELRLVFPKLRPSPHESDAWTQTKLVVDRPSGIRDPSLTAVGVGGSLPGSRLSWILVDDILDEENTATPQGRQRTNQWFWSTVVSRRDVSRDGQRNARVAVVNTPWNNDQRIPDLTYDLERAGWPTLTMDIEGGIQITHTEWDTDLVRPSLVDKSKVFLRLSSNDNEEDGAPLTAVTAKGRMLVKPGKRVPTDARLEHFDLEDEVPLWPRKYSRAVVENLRVEYREKMEEFNRHFMMRCRSDATARVKKSWITTGQMNATLAGFHRFVDRYQGPNVTVTGLDLAWGEKADSDLVSFFTIEIIPKLEISLGDQPPLVLRNVRRILDIEVGRWRGRTVIDKLIDKVRRFNSTVRVETNGGQEYLRQWTLDVDIAVPVRAHHTGENKHHRIRGVEGVFLEIENGAWLFPTDPAGAIPDALSKFFDDILFYKPPPAHTGDVLMSCWLAREEARFILGDSNQEVDPRQAVAAAMLLSR